MMVTGGPGATDLPIVAPFLSKGILGFLEEVSTSRSIACILKILITISLITIEAQRVSAGNALQEDLWKE